MLNKAICKQCSLRFWPLFTGGLGWGENDDIHWKNGFVLCAKLKWNKERQRKQFIKEGPPDECPYILEHVVMEQQNAK